MKRRLLIALFIAVAFGVAERGVEANSKPVRVLKPEGFDLSRNPELAFGATGELYVACRDRETRDASSFLSVVALDVTTGSELRRSRLGVPRISLAGHFPWPLAKFMLSPDGSLLLYSYIRFLRGRIVSAFMFDLDNREAPFEMIMRYDASSETPRASTRIDGCEFNSSLSALTFDQRFVIQLCKRIRQTDPGFGQVLKSNLLVVDTQTLRVAAEIPTPSRWKGFSAWHGSAHTLVAIATSTHGIEICSLADSSEDKERAGH